jgi:cytidylate kinase
MVIVITGIMAAGKSTVAQMLAERLPRSVHVRGDLFRRMIVSGRAQPTPAGSAEEESQLTLRYRLSAQAADSYAAAGFTAVVQDVILGDHLTAYARMIRTRPCHIVVLAPRPEVVAAREAGRPKIGYGDWTVGSLHEALEGTPRIGLWLDTSDQSPAETVEAIMAWVRRQGRS